MARDRSVVLMLPSFAPGGAERIVAWLAEALATAGWRVAILTLDGGRTRSFYPVHRDVKLMAFDIAHAPWKSRFREMLRLRRYLISDASVLLSFIAGAHGVAGFVTIGLALPLIVCERDYLGAPIALAKRILRHLAHIRAQAIVLQTERFRSLLVPSVQGKLRIIPNPVIPASNCCAVRDRVVVAVGRLVPKKGFDLLLRAWALCPEVTESGWRLEIYGDGPERSRLEVLTKRLNISGSVRILATTNQVEEVYQRAGIFVLPSRFEGFPNVLGEAMAHGVPVVAFDAPGAMADLVQDRKTGLLVPADDVPGLAAALSELVASPELRDTLGAQGQRSIERFNPKAVRGEWLRVLDRYQQ